MAVKQKGRDNDFTNEGREAKRGFSKTELMGLMKKMMGTGDAEALPDSPLMPNLPKGGKRGTLR